METQSFYVITANGLQTIRARGYSESGDLLFILEDGFLQFLKKDVLWWGPVNPRMEGSPFQLMGALRHVPTRSDHVLPGERKQRPVSPQEKPRLIDTVTKVLLDAVSPHIPREWTTPVVYLDADYLMKEWRYVERIRFTDEKSGAQAFEFSDPMLTAITVFRRVTYECGNLWAQCIVTFREGQDGRGLVEFQFVDHPVVARFK